MKAALCLACMAAARESADACYANRYPDLKRRLCRGNNCDAPALREHYARHGRREGRRYCPAVARVAFVVPTHAPSHAFAAQLAQDFQRHSVSGKARRLLVGFRPFLLKIASEIVFKKRGSIRAKSPEITDFPGHRRHFGEDNGTSLHFVYLSRGDVARSRLPAPALRDVFVAGELGAAPAGYVPDCKQVAAVSFLCGRRAEVTCGLL